MKNRRTSRLGTAKKNYRKTWTAAKRTRRLTPLFPIRRKIIYGRPLKCCANRSLSRKIQVNIRENICRWRRRRRAFEMFDAGRKTEVENGDRRRRRRKTVKMARFNGSFFSSLLARSRSSPPSLRPKTNFGRFFFSRRGPEGCDRLMFLSHILSFYLREEMFCDAVQTLLQLRLTEERTPTGNPNLLSLS